MVSADIETSKLTDCHGYIFSEPKLKPKPVKGDPWHVQKSKDELTDESIELIYSQIGHFQNGDKMALAILVANTVGVKVQADGALDFASYKMAIRVDKGKVFSLSTDSRNSNFSEVIFGDEIITAFKKGKMARVRLCFRLSRDCDIYEYNLRGFTKAYNSLRK